MSSIGSNQRIYLLVKIMFWSKLFDVKITFVMLCFGNQTIIEVLATRRDTLKFLRKMNKDFL